MNIKYKIIQNSIALVTINEPKTYNSLSFKNLSDLIKLFKNLDKDKKTKVVRYTYDELLFDFSQEDGKETLNKIQEILESGGKYPVKFKYAKDLSL